MVVPTVEPSDEALAARAAAGDDRAFEAIVERYRACPIAWRAVSRRPPRARLLQDTFLQVYRHLPSFEVIPISGRGSPARDHAALMLRRARAGGPRIPRVVPSALAARRPRPASRTATLPARRL